MLTSFFQTHRQEHQPPMSVPPHGATLRRAARARAARAHRIFFWTPPLEGGIFFSEPPPKAVYFSLGPPPKGPLFYPDPPPTKPTPPPPPVNNDQPLKCDRCTIDGDGGPSDLEGGYTGVRSVSLWLVSPRHPCHVSATRSCLKARLKGVSPARLG